MYAVLVTFEISPDHMDVFLPLMLQNAATSLAQEPGCHQFDVCTDPARPAEVVLYELYTDAAAFNVHLASDHFKTFDAQVGPMLAAKDVRTYERVQR